MAEGPANATPVAAIAIGRNEGARLDACLASVRPRCAPVVYVDSGSTDGSAARARASGVHVVDLDMTVPFTAARARNAGLAALAAASGGAVPPYVQFVDGDCAVREGWVETAAAFFDANPDHAVVCGRRRERAPESSIWNLLVDMEWDTRPGPAAACGGDALMRRAAVEAVGGYRDDLIAGEEPEMCLRLRRTGWKIHRLDAEMTWHEAGLDRFGQWWRRTARAGWAAAEGAMLHGGGPERYNLRRVLRLALWGVTWPVAVLAALLATHVGSTIGVWTLAGLIALWLVMARRITRFRRRVHGDEIDAAVRYGVFTMIGKIAEAAGAARYLAQRVRGGPARLIEYRRPS
ncbi:MAG: glycosyltransferase [Paracoccaceae bacterium]